MATDELTYRGQRIVTMTDGQVAVCLNGSTQRLLKARDLEDAVNLIDRHEVCDNCDRLLGAHYQSGLGCPSFWSSTVFKGSGRFR